MESESLKVWELISEIGFIAVIIGVALEVVDLCAKWYERCKGKRLPKHLHRWILPVETLGFGILVAGLAVEFLGSHKVMQIAARQNAVLFATGERAREAAANAENAAEKAKLERALAEKSVEQFRQENLVLQSNVFALKSNLLALETTTQEVKRKTESLEPRRLNEEKQRKLFSLLQNFQTTKFAFNLDPRIEDAEGLAMDLGNVMVQRGYEYVGVDRVSKSAGPVNHGIAVSVIGSTNSPTELIGALNAVGLNAHPPSPFTGGSFMSVGGGSIGLGALRGRRGREVEERYKGVIYLDIGFR